MSDKERQQARSFLSRPAVHVCVDMQRMFSEKTDWHTPWMDRVTPVVEAFVAERPEDTIFTRFVPPEKPEDADGAWQEYFSHWRHFTREVIDPELIELVPPLARFVPPAAVFDKPVYSPFAIPGFRQLLGERKVETIIVTGAETDVCVLATILSAIDAGYFVVVARDALCSSSDQTHDALIDLYKGRFGRQVTLTDTAEILSDWRS